MVTNRSSEPLTYEYVVINNARLPVHRIALGRAEKVAAEMENMPENVPVSVSSPPGWAGKTLFGYESKYMNIAWVANKGVAGIQPGSRLGGFVLTMPARSGQLARDEDGREQRPMDMMRIPYVVTFDDTSEQVGVVKPPEK